MNCSYITWVKVEAMYSTSGNIILFCDSLVNYIVVYVDLNLIYV